MISIIIPIYNVKDYIEKCLKSVAAQTYTGPLECLIIDDCGQDESIIIAEEFVRNYKGNIDFRIIHHKKNKGVSAARNTGIKESKGEWLFFLDSDDYISNDCIELMMNSSLLDTSLDMVIGDVNVINNLMDNKEQWSLLKLNEGINENGLIERYVRYDYPIPPWNKLIRKSFIIDHSLFFEEGLIHEDYLWSFCVACQLRKIAVVSDKTYFYNRREGSLDNQKNQKIHILNYSKACNLQAKYLKYKTSLWGNKLLYKYIDHKRYTLLIDAYKTQDKDFFRQCYDLLRSAPEWGLIKKIRSCFTFGELLLSFHRYLPFNYGMKLYKMIISKYND